METLSGGPVRAQSSPDMGLDRVKKAVAQLSVPRGLDCPFHQPASWSLSRSGRVRWIIVALRV